MMTRNLFPRLLFTPQPLFGPAAVYGNVMHNLLMDELELGLRVARAIDNELCMGPDIVFWSLYAKWMFGEKVAK